MFSILLLNSDVGDTLSSLSFSLLCSCQHINIYINSTVFYCCFVFTDSVLTNTLICVMMFSFWLWTAMQKFLDRENKKQNNPLFWTNERKKRNKTELVGLQIRFLLAANSDLVFNSLKMAWIAFKSNSLMSRL